MKKSEDHKDNKNEFKLDEVSRENIYRVPEGYFDELPGIIQSRVTEKTGERTFWQSLLATSNSWKWALATAVVALILVFSGVFNNNNVGVSVEDMLAEVSLEDLIEYVEYSEISTEEILAELDFSDFEASYLMGDDIMLLNDEELESLDEMDLYEVYGIDEDLF